MLRFALCALLASPFTVAQGQLLIVDANQGPGSQFADLPAAVAAAVSGDRISVRPGDYSGFTIDGKGIAVVGGPGVTLTRAPLAVFVTIKNVPAGRDCTVSGLVFAPVLLSGTLRVEDCAGRVLLQDLSAGYRPLLSTCR